VVRAGNSPDDNVLVRTPVHRIPTIAGSCAEFFIQPMLPFVGDIAIMVHRCDVLAIPDGYPPPTEKPAEFHSSVMVYEIIDSEYPGYVYLMSSYLLTEDSDTGKYNSEQYERRHMSYVLFYANKTDEHRGPSMTLFGTDTDEGMPVDNVPCLRCLSWPPQAADWSKRHRDYDWPGSATVDCVVSNGCDVVRAVHRRSREDDWESKYQFRLSFSRAEIVLLNSWMPVQQIVYHMLRFFTKTEQLTYITDSAGTKIFSNYHLKTLALWACELKSQRWWTDDMNVVRKCTKLLHTFADWLRSEMCPHYFVNSCNLLNSTVHSEVVVSQLASMTESWLSTWFVNNYLHKCAQLCPDRVSRLFDDVSTSVKLQNAVSAVVDWRLNTALRDLLCWCCHTEVYVSKFLSEFFSDSAVTWLLD